MPAPFTIVLFEDQEIDAAHLINWAIRSVRSQKAPLKILTCRVRELLRPPQVLQSDAAGFSVAVRTIIEAAVDIEIEIWSLESPDLGQAIIGFVDEHEVSTLFIGANGHMPMDPTEAPLEERLIRFSPCEIVVLDPGSTDGKECDSILIPMGDDLAIDALRSATDLTSTAQAKKLIPLLVGQAFGVDAEEIARRELERELMSAGLKSHPCIEPAVCLAARSSDGILAATRANGCQAIVIAATSTRALRRLREAERSLTNLDSYKSPAIAITRPAKIRTRGLVDFLTTRMLHWLPQLDASERLELFDRLQSGARWDKNFSIMIGLSTAIASLGLIQSAPAVVIGAMLVAPLMTPLIAAGLALVQGNLRLFRSSAQAMFRGVVAGFILSVIIGFITPNSGLSQEILSRGSPTILDLLVALLSGMAAAYVIAQPSLLAAMAGVAIAAALIPPLSCIGLALADGSWRISIGAAILLTANLVAIILGAAFVFRGVGVQGSQLGVGRPLWVRRAMLGLTLATVVLAAPLGYRLSTQIRQGQDRPLLHPLNPALEFALSTRVNAEPGVDILLLGRTNSYAGFSVGLQLLAEKSVPQSLIDDLREMIHERLGSRVRIYVDVVQRGEVTDDQSDQ